MNGHYFAISAVDRTLSYKPETKIVFDILSAFTIFYTQAHVTVHKISKQVNNLCSSWNEKYSKQEVRNNTHAHYKKKKRCSICGSSVSRLRDSILINLYNTNNKCFLYEQKQKKR